MDKDNFYKYVQAKIIQASLDETEFQVMVEENFKPMYSITTKEKYDELVTEGLLDYVGEMEFLNGEADIYYCSKFGVCLSTNPNPENVANCHAVSEVQSWMKHDDRFTRNEKFGGF